MRADAHPFFAGAEAPSPRVVDTREQGLVPLQNHGDGQGLGRIGQEETHDSGKIFRFVNFSDIAVFADDIPQQDILGVFERQRRVFNGVGVIHHLRDLGDCDVVKDGAATSGEFPVLPGEGFDAQLCRLVDHDGMIVHLS